ncbi:MAG: ABC transporter permease [Actinomycetota bacterium]|nr:ABC transporter permease [Actinomycetota bacterium]
MPETAVSGGLRLRAAGGRLHLAALRDYAILIAFIVLFIVLAVSSDVFLTQTNLLNILNQWSTIGIIACGATLVIIAGGFDLSVGAILAIAGVAAAKVANSVGVPAGLLVGIAMGLGWGIVNGLLATVGRINPFIATLATSFVIRGVALAMTGGFIITVTEPGFTTLGRDELFGVKWTIWIFVAFAAITWFLLSRTTYGRYVFAAGGNAEAARLSGIRVGLIRGSTFAISGLSAGIAGVLVSSRVASGQADAGAGVELQAIAAVVIGGTSILGGEGAIWRTLLGVLLLGLIQNGFNLLNVDPVYQQIFYGGIIIGAVALDAWARRTGS